MQQDNLITCEIYQDKVNIELFNETISFVIDTSPSEKISNIIRHLRQTNLWYQKVENVVLVWYKKTACYCRCVYNYGISLLRQMQYM